MITQLTTFRNTHFFIEIRAETATILKLSDGEDNEGVNSVIEMANVANYNVEVISGQEHFTNVNGNNQPLRENIRSSQAKVFRGTL